ncbi:aminopeptidase [Salinirubellus salinus]|uniref:Aminopeptidase n=1 Tax=Salinirubellus salinus TaxID=1364945 RepID=A0A9E7R1T4_9EURY|nr:aminopeptidase [Salinirubellus salinus]UWM54186.1 aminopeptidase [Salinirubellus salinus]
MTEDELGAAARTAVEQCLALEADESLVVVTDDEREPIGEALYRAGRDVTDDVTMVRYPPGGEHGEEPPAAVASAMRHADAFLAPTSKSLSHTRARGDASDSGVRGATLPGITEAVFTAGLDADYDAIAAECETMLEQVAEAEEIRVTSPSGTDITFRPGDREWFADTGVIHEAGEFGNLPAGEVFVAPEDANGTYVVDGTISPHGLLEEGHTVEITVEDGWVTAVSDDEVRAALEAAAEKGGDGAYNLAELGIGTNTAVTELVGSVLLDEKAGGTVHIAFGDDMGLGGDTDAAIHADGVLRDPTVLADGVEVALPTVE